jgi:Flp pilus assembly protein TadB
MIDILPKFLAFLAMGIVAQIPTEFFSVIEKFGVIGLLAMFCWLLWHRDEKRTAQFEGLLERFLQGQHETNTELKKQSQLLEDRVKRRDD